MSDAIVLWRMCVIWEYKRWTVVIATLLVITTLVLNITNISFLGKALIQEVDEFNISTNIRDSEILITYGLSTIGLAAAFVSLASNFSATVLVGLKALCVIACVGVQCLTNSFQVIQKAHHTSCEIQR